VEAANEVIMNVPGMAALRRWPEFAPHGIEEHIHPGLSGFTQARVCRTKVSSDDELSDKLVEVGFRVHAIMPANDCVHLPGRLQGTDVSKNRHAGLVATLGSPDITQW
jgi:hypothetical protein